MDEHSWRMTRVLRLRQVRGVRIWFANGVENDYQRIKYNAYLTNIDDKVRRGAQRFSLVVEIDITPRETTNALKIYVVAHQYSSRKQAADFRWEHGLSLVAAASDVANGRYQKGGLWPDLEDKLKETGSKWDRERSSEL